MPDPSIPPAPPSGDDGPWRPREAWGAWLVALALLLAFAGVRDLFDADEGRYAAVALDMRRSGDYVTPREDGLRFLDKPPLVYWAAGAAYAVLGPTPLAARLPCIVAGSALAAFAFLFAGAWAGTRRAAWLGALVTATCLGGMGLSRTVTMDMPLSAAVAGALFAGWRALDRDGWRPRAAAGLALGLGLLAKGPLAVVVTGLVAMAWGLAGAPWRRLLRVASSPVVWLVAAAVAVPWYVLCERANPGYLRHFLVYEHFRRFREAGQRDFAPVWLYAATLPLFLAPWTPLLWRARIRREVAAGGGKPVPAERFAWAWALSLLVFYSLGRNRLWTYILPALLPLAVLAGARLAQALDEGDAAARRLGRVAAAEGALLALAGAGLAFASSTSATLTLFGKRVLPLRDPRLAAAGLPVALGALPLLLAPWALRLARTPRARAAVLVLAAACLWWGVDLGAARVGDLRSARALAATLAREKGPDDLVVCLDLLPQGLRFYEDLHVSVAGKQPEIVEPWASLDGRGVLLREEDLPALWASPRRVLLVAREAKARPFLERGGRRLAHGLSGAQRSDLDVVENRPASR